MFLAIIFVLVNTVIAQLSCPPLEAPYAQCSSNVVIAIDASLSMDSHVRIDQEFAYVINNLLPRAAYQFGQNISILSYGTDGLVTPNPPTTSEITACNTLNRLWGNSQNIPTLSVVSLQTVLQDISLNYNRPYVFLFSGSKNQNDIKAAASYYQSSNNFAGLSIIDFNGGVYSSFGPNVPIYAIMDPVINPTKYPYLPQCLFQQSCGIMVSCSSMTGNQATLAPPPTTIPTTTPRPTPIRPTNPPYPSDKYQCRCNYNTSWNDVIFLISTSASMGKRGLLAVTADLQSAMDNFNIQDRNYAASQYYTRVGVIGYGATASVIASLGSINNYGLDTINIPYTGGDITNLEEAIQAASHQFALYSRPASRKVIYIFSSAYNGNGVHDPRMAAATFRGTGGIIIAYDYVQSGGVSDNVIQEVASPGYFLDSRTSSAIDQIQVLCDANCFCGSDQFSYKSDNTRQLPTGACYTNTGGISLTYSRALSYCSTAGPEGILPKIESSDKAEFIVPLYEGSIAWIGLSWNSFYAKYQWNDASFLGSYQPWSLQPTIPPSQYFTSVKMIKTGNNQDSDWQQEYATNGYSHAFVCQTAPCDSTRWCDRTAV